MVDSQFLARGIFGSYFVLILSLFYLILNSWRRRARLLGKLPGKAILFSALALGSFYHTWFYMIKFLLWSFHDFESRGQNVNHKSVLDRVTQWLMGTDLFEQAWRRVCQAPQNWWWSEQLCILTVGVWTTFLFTQGSRQRVPLVWAYMLLGQVVAISVACNLFFVAIVLHEEPNDASSKRASKPSSSTERTSSRTLVPPRVYVPILLSHLTILLAPFVSQPDSPWFLPNLLVMHTLIVIPLLSTKPSRTGLPQGTFYLALASLALIPRAQTYFSLRSLNISSLAQGLLNTLYSHPAQSSIGFDVVWTTASFAVYCAAIGGAALGLVGFISPGLALYLDGDD